MRKIDNRWVWKVNDDWGCNHQTNPLVYRISPNVVIANDHYSDYYIICDDCIACVFLPRNIALLKPDYR